MMRIRNNTFLNNQIKFNGEELDLKIQLAWWSALLKTVMKLEGNVLKKQVSLFQERIDKYEK